MYMDIEVVPGNNEKIFKSWDGFYLESKSIKPGVHEVTKFGKKMFITGISFIFPEEVREFYKNAHDHIKITNISF